VFAEARRGRSAVSTSERGAVPGTSPGPALEVCGLSRTYGSGDVAVRALRHVSFQVDPGDMVCIMGKSGSGKSTLLRQLGLLDTPTSGQVLLDGVDVTRIRESRRRVLRLGHLGYVFQEYALLPELTAEENVYLPSLMTGSPLRQSQLRARELLEMLDLENRARHRPSELSGGQQQRVAIARAMVNRPTVLFADEPTGNLDTESSEMVMRALTRMNEELGVTILFVSHEADDRRFAKNVIVLRDGEIVEAAG
jgi:putative ABC transport system ATP-binding protein